MSVVNVLLNRKARKEGAKYAKSNPFTSVLCDLCVFFFVVFAVIGFRLFKHSRDLLLIRDFSRSWIKKVNLADQR